MSGSVGTKGGSGALGLYLRSGRQGPEPDGSWLVVILVVLIVVVLAEAQRQDARQPDKSDLPGSGEAPASGADPCR